MTEHVHEWRHATEADATGAPEQVIKRSYRCAVCLVFGWVRSHALMHRGDGARVPNVVEYLCNVIGCRLLAVAWCGTKGTMAKNQWRCAEHASNGAL